MITSLSQLDLNKRYSYAEYLTWQFQERLELIKGKIFKMSPAPARSHQRTSMELSFQIRNYLSGKDCYIYTAPFDVRFPKSQGDENTFTVVQPDICIVCDKSKLDDRGCVGAPDMIIEILSAATSAKDATVKFDLYEEQGVKEYWMVSPSENLVDVFVLDENGKYQWVKKYTENDRVRVNVFEDLYINMSEVFRD